MNIQEAKFVLGAYRADGSDAADPRFADALALAGRDPELRAWFEQRQQFDRVVADRVRAIVPPPGLRDSILAGARASRPRPRWWLHPTTLAAAAAIVVLGVLGYRNLPGAAQPAGKQLVGFALNDMMLHHDDHVGFPAGMENVQGQLASARVPLTEGVNLDLEELRRRNCRTVRVGQREVFEICFNRDGVWYHLYAARRSDFAPGTWDARALLAAKGEYAATAWADARNVYALVVHEAPAALQRLL